LGLSGKGVLNTPQAEKVALVTGASFGVGAATALALARDGFRLVLTATSEKNLEATVGRVKALGGQVAALALDLRSQDSIEKAAASAIAPFGRIDVLVNNAGANLRRKAVDTTRQEWDDLFNVNLTGTFFLTQQIGRHLIARNEGGRIISISSSHALIGAAERSAYGISKAAVVQMTRMLAIEWAEHNITVNNVAPGRLDTDSPSRAAKGQDPDYMAAMLKNIPLHRLATADEVAGAVAFLAGPSAASITGQTIIIDGGLTAK
jgi:NAD(P)-dependent dehydrogenase (short-subunit alcohol dehydrogenase family)